MYPDAVVVSHAASGIPAIARLTAGSVAGGAFNPRTPEYHP